MSKDDTGHQCCYCQTGDIKSNLDPGIFYLCDICQFSREKICRNDWQTTAIIKESLEWVRDCPSFNQTKVLPYEYRHNV